MAKNIVNIVFLSDTHLGIDYPLRPRISRRRRGDDFFENYRRVIDYAKNTNIDVLIHGGDLFFRSRVPGKIIDLAYEPLIDLAEMGVPVYIVAGNHERSCLPSMIYLNHHNIHFFNEPKIYSQNISGALVSLAGFPFVRHDVRSRFQKIVDPLSVPTRQAKLKILCMHQALEGARVGPSNFTFRNRPDTVRINDLPSSFDMVLCGHIHRFQILRKIEQNTAKSIPIIYPGSIERTSFAEKSEEKGFCHIACTWTPDLQLDIQFHKLKTRPMIDIHIDQNLDESNLEVFIRNKSAGLPNDAILRFKGNHQLDEKVRDLMTSAFLRNILPEAMNFQLSGDFRDAK